MNQRSRQQTSNYNRDNPTWTSFFDEVAKLQLIIDDIFQKKEIVEVLEAGCGSASQITFGNNVYVTGIDISEKQLERSSLLNEKILGDIQTYQLPSEYYDIIICWDVLEHLKSPDNALANFYRGVKNGGLIVLAMPNATSFEAVITKFVPHWLNVMIHRHVFGNKGAGKEGRGPFKAYMRLSISPSAIIAFARKNGLRIERVAIYTRGRIERLEERSKTLYVIYRAAAALVKLLSVGTIEPKYSSCIAVLRKE